MFYVATVTFHSYYCFCDSCDSDKDLGAPNGECPGGGPGRGVDGEPGPNNDNPYQNCSPQGNVLIIQEDNRDNRCGLIPDDNVDGGHITMDFSPMATKVNSLQLLDVDYPVNIVVVYKDDKGKIREKPLIEPPVTGDNSLQTVDIDCKNVVQLRLNLRRSGAVTSLKFCHMKDSYYGKKDSDYRKLSEQDKRNLRTVMSSN